MFYMKTIMQPIFYQTEDHEWIVIGYQEIWDYRPETEEEMEALEE